MRSFLRLLGLSLLGSFLVISYACDGPSGATLAAVPTPSIPTPTIQSTVVCSNSTAVGYTSPGFYKMPYTGDVLSTAVTLPAGQLQALGLYLYSATGLVQAAVYADGWDSEPGNLVTQSAAQTAVNGWNILDLPSASVTAGTYWMSSQTQGGTLTGSSFNGSAVFFAMAWGAFPAISSEGPVSNLWETNMAPSDFIVYCPQ